MYEYTNIKKEKGFTLVELLVAMSVFTALLAFAVGVFVQGMRSERQVTEEIAVNYEMSLVLEQLVREIRTGSFFAPLGGYTKGN
ncbi:MAG: type II secretion system protein, partial [Patescibacteria group bacterium]